MKKLFVTGILALFVVSCASATKEAPKGDIFTELRKLNTVDEKGLNPKDKENHVAHKADLNQQLGEFLKQEENVTDFPSIEDRKQELASDIIELNNKDEANLQTEELSDLRNQRAKNIDDLQALLQKGMLFQEIKNLNKVDEKSLSPDDKVRHDSYKTELNNRLAQLLTLEENKSSNPEVENRKQEILHQLSDINNEDESKLTPSELTALREQRESLLNELLGLIDGSIVPTPPPAPPVEEPAPAEPTPAPAEPVEQPELAPAPAAPPVEEPVKAPKPRGELFSELMKLNEVNEAELSPADKAEHQALKQDLNRELTELLNKEENKFSDPKEEEEKNTLKDELIGLNNTDESTLAPEQLKQLRDRRAKIVERMQDLLKNAKRYPAVDYGITSQKKEGIAVKQEVNGTFQVVFTDLLFAFNKTDLKLDVRKTLAKISKLLKEHPEATADIGGHSDNIGPAWAKKKIAKGRADNAKKYLVNAGVEEERLNAKGYSDKKPLAKPFTSKNRRKNRRVEIRIKMQKEEEASPIDEESRVAEDTAALPQEEDNNSSVENTLPQEEGNDSMAEDDSDNVNLQKEDQTQNNGGAGVTEPTPLQDTSEQG